MTEARIALALAVLTACGGVPPPDPRQEGNWEGLAPPGALPAPTILLIVLDTLRADHLSLYGYGRPTSPVLAELAEEARVYTRARSTAPWTLPSHASLFTGLYPHQHGAHTRRGADGSKDYATPLDDEVTTLAELLSGRGYRTAAVVANEGFLHPRFRLDQGFDVYDAGRGTVREINERALAWLDAQGAPLPVFLFLNYMDTHRPYNCSMREGFPYHGGDRTSGARMKRARKILIDGAPELPADLVQELVDQYDTAIANLDEGLGELFDALRARGRWDNTLVVVTSDHGEFFGEHALVEHSKDVYEPVLSVPLIVRPPGGVPAERDERPIAGAHVPGIVLSWAGMGPGDVPRFFDCWPRSDVFAENHYSRQHDMRGVWRDRLGRVRRAIYRDDWKLIESSDGAHELYDLASDPDEARNLFVSEPGRAEELAAALSAQIRSAAERRAELVDLAEHDPGVMSELGYAGDDGESSDQ